MNNNMKKLFRMATLAVCGAMMIVSCTDTWDDHYEALPGTGTGGTTMEYLNTHASDFAEILKAAGFDANLNSSQVFTILAPKNGSFDKKALLAQLASGDKDQVVDRFIKNHVLLYNISLNNEEKDAYLLNEKRVHFGTLNDMLIDDVTVEEPNIVCGNGIIHVMADAVRYKASVYEQIEDNFKQYLADNNLEDDGTIVSLYNFLKKYDHDSLDPNRSVEYGQDEDGNIIYSDSFIIRNNQVLRALNAYLYREDSTYWVIDPGVEAYQKLYNKAFELFKFNDAYAEDVTRRDSMQNYYAQYNIIGELFYNANINEAKVIENVPESKGDSLVTTSYNRWDWKHHSYKDVFSSDGILGNIDEKQECSNGYVFTQPQGSDMPYTLYDAFFHDVQIQTGPSTLVPEVGGGRSANDEWTKSSTFLGYYNNLSNDSVSNGYYRVEGRGVMQKPTLSFRLSNTLSGTYDIYICVLPWNVYDPDVLEEEMIPVKFKAMLFEADEHDVIPYLKNSENAYNFTPGTNDFVECWKNKSTSKVDTVFVGTHTFNYCYRYTGASGAYLKLSLERSIAERNHQPYPLYDNKFLIDFILLKPHREVEPDEPDNPENPDDEPDDPFINPEHH